MGLDELRDCNVATFAHAPPVDLDSRDFMKSLGSHSKTARNRGAVARWPNTACAGTTISVSSGIPSFG